MWNLIRKSKWAERRKDGRMPAPDLDVSYSTELEQRKVRIKDISATGVYLLTEQPLQPGTDVNLTLQRCSTAEDEALLGTPVDELRGKVRLRAKAVRVGEDGVGVTFAQNNVDGSTWSTLMAALAKVTGETDRVRLLRMTKALAFVLHISPAAEMEMLGLITQKISLERAGRVVEMALWAEDLAGRHSGGIRTDVSASLVLHILEDGSKVDEEETRKMWAELLAASCVEGANDQTIVNYVGLLSKIDAVQMRIFDAACRLGLRVGWEKGFKFRQDLHGSAEEIKKITHIQNLMGIERDLNHLYELGLLEQTDRPILCQQVERVNMTPTSLGLRLYARCKGQPEPPESCEGATLPRAS